MVKSLELISCVEKERSKIMKENTCAIIFVNDLKSGLAGIRRGVPSKTSVPEDPSAAKRSEKNTLNKCIYVHQ